MPAYQVRAQETQNTELPYVILTADSATAKEVAAEFDGERIDNSKKLVEVGVTKKEVQKLQKDKDVIYVEENITLTGSAENIENPAVENADIPNLEAKQWNREALGVTADKNTESREAGNSVKIEILDSGVSASTDIHAEKYIDLSRDVANGEFNPMFADDNGHGTAMASVIAAAENEEGIAGINPDARIYSVKALDSENQSPLSRIVEGIYWGIENDMDIINMSFGTSVDSEILHKAIQDAYNHGILLVAAAGNTQHREVQYPAAYEEVIAVGSANEAGKLSEDTSIGTELELLAPGENVVSEDVMAAPTIVSGTSIATAQVSAVASLLMQNHPEKTSDFIRALMKRASKKVESCSAGFIDYQYAEKIYDGFADTYIKTDIIEIKSYNNTPVADYSNEAEEMIEGLWDKNAVHANMYGITNNLGISDAQYGVIKKAAAWPDDINGYSKKDSSYENLRKNAKLNTSYEPDDSLHGTANYIAHAMYLWYLADYLGNANTTPASDSALNSLINSAKASAKSAMKQKVARK